MIRGYISHFCIDAIVTMVSSEGMLSFHAYQAPEALEEASDR